MSHQIINWIIFTLLITLYNVVINKIVNLHHVVDIESFLIDKLNFDRNKFFQCEIAFESRDKYYKKMLLLAL